MVKNPCTGVDSTLVSAIIGDFPGYGAGHGSATRDGCAPGRTTLIDNRERKRVVVSHLSERVRACSRAISNTNFDDSGPSHDGPVMGVVSGSRELVEFFLESLILAQDERWRRA